MTERNADPEKKDREQANPEKAKEHAEQEDIPTGATPEAVEEEEDTGGALTNREG